MSRSSDIKEISNPQEFKEFYLNDAYHSFCEECNTIEYIYGSGFLEVIALEELKKIQKKLSETGQEESFTVLYCLQKARQKKLSDTKISFWTGIYVFHF